MRILPSVCGGWRSRATTRKWGNVRRFFVTLAVLATACGGDDDGGGSGPQTTGPSTTGGTTSASNGTGSTTAGTPTTTGSGTTGNSNASGGDGSGGDGGSSPSTGGSTASGGSGGDGGDTTAGGAGSGGAGPGGAGAGNTTAATGGVGGAPVSCAAEPETGEACSDEDETCAIDAGCCVCEPGPACAPGLAWTCLSPPEDQPAACGDEAPESGSDCGSPDQTCLYCSGDEPSSWTCIQPVAGDPIWSENELRLCQ